MFQKWKTDLKRIYDDQLLDLMLNREIFRQFSDATSRHTGSHQGAELAKWMQQGYVAFAGTAIRRLLEEPSKRNRSVSLVILLRELQQHKHLLTRRWFCSHYKGIVAKIADRDFDSIARKKGVARISADRIERDIARLERAAEPVRRLVNKVIAHTERDRRRIGRPKYGQINAAIDEIVATYKRYRLLIEQRGGEPSEIVRTVRVSDDLARIWP